MIEKTCPICGKMFSTTRSQKVYCSYECYRINVRNTSKYYYMANKDHIKRKIREYRPTALCKLCGQLINQPLIHTTRRSSKQFHDECVIIDAKNTIKSGRYLTNVQYQRLLSRGYTVTELKEEMGL